MSYHSSDRSYEPGEVIVPRCDPFYKVLCLAHKDTRCNTCFKKTDDLRKCRECNNVSYCTPDCRLKDHNNGHYLECTPKGFKKIMKYFANEARIKLFRLYALLKSNPHLSQERYTMHDKTTRCFYDLMPRDIDWSSEYGIIGICQDMVKCLEGEDNEVTVDHFIRLQSIIQTSAFPICEEGVLIGHGIYMECSKFKHSCKPTANFSIIDAKLEVRAMVTIIRGESPSISHLDLSYLEDRTTRRAILEKQLMLVCFCQRCIFEENVPFDYAEFKEMHAKMETLMATPSASVTMGWKEVLDLHYQYIALLRVLLNENDEVITTYLVNFCRLAEKLNADKKVIAHLMKETLGHIRITFGENCTLYQEFNNPSNKN